MGIVSQFKRTLFSSGKPKLHDAKCSDTFGEPFVDQTLSSIFDRDYYLQRHADVCAAGVDAKDHFLKYGVFENREIFHYDGEISNVLFVDGIGNATTVYRVYNVVNALRFAGVSCSSVSVPFIKENVYEVNKYDLVVLVRVAWDEGVKEVVKFCRSMGVPVAADFDDYVFEPSIVSKKAIDGIRDFDDEMMCDYLDGVVRYRQTLQMVDFATLSTPFLVEKAKSVNKSSFLIPNSLEANLYGSALGWKGFIDATAKKVNARSKIVSYLSGSKTHQKDFWEVAPALAAIMKEREEVKLRVYGELDLSEYDVFGGLESRIEMFPLVPFSEYFSKLPEIFINSYIAIAPLDVNSEFCAAKSELKYFEAAAFGVPVIASSTDTYTRAIENSVNGFLASNTEDWKDYIFSLLNDISLYEQVSLESRVHSLSKYGPMNLMTTVLQVYEDALATRKSKAKVTWLVPGPIPPESGGHNSILFAAREMVRRGFDVRMALTCGEDGVGPSYEAIKYKFGSYGGIKLSAGIDHIEASDILVATHFETALSLIGRESLAKSIYYFVQDYEPYFGAVGTDFFRAEHTYKLGFKHITIGRWLAGMVSKYSDDTRSIDFWVDRDKYYVDCSAEKHSNVVTFFARPSMPRRCYELGVAALSELYKANQNVEIRFFGERDFPSAGIDFPFLNMGVLNKDELRVLYNESSLVIAFSTTNPSIATFEIMACGTPVVDLDVFEARDRHFGYPAILCSPIVADIASRINSLISNPMELNAISELSVEFAKKMPDPLEPISRMVDYIESDINCEVAPQCDIETVIECS